MSLISDALKKARQEAARQDALHQGVPYAVGTADARGRRNPLLPVLAGLGAGCLFAGLLFAVAWTGGWGPFAKPQTPAPVQVAQAAAASPAPAIQVQEETPLPPVAAPTPAPQPATPKPDPLPLPPPKPPTVEPETPAPQPATPEPITPPVAAPVETTPAVEPAPAPMSEPAAPAPPSAAAGGLEEGKVYSGEVPVPGGGSLKLNGIAYSQERPVAVLDGRVMGPGEAIQGFTVVAIEAGRVKLQGYGATVFLSPR